MADGADEDGAAQSGARGQQPGAAPLGHDGQPEEGGHGARLVGVGGDEGARVRDAEAAAGRGERRLVGDERGEPPRLLGQQEPADRAVRLAAQLVQGDGGRVVQGQQDGGGPGERVGDPGEGAADARRPAAGVEVEPARVPGARHGPRRGAGHHVDGDAGAAQGADGAERAVVERVPVEPHQYGGDPGVTERHGKVLVSLPRPGDEIH
ncbi:hypothetical protein [Streptomyces somaliensis]|uniref:hypothetical protein n=1 Tax=Streptomyces somaliensis TaxID=78355 RepID=UPI0027E55C89|nr:hypothetical protein [Streptomyces somaliensis]